MTHRFLQGVTRALLAMGGVPIPEGVIVTRDQKDFDYKETFPAVVKPTRMENSVGVELVHTKEEMEVAARRGNFAEARNAQEQVRFWILGQYDSCLTHGVQNR